MNNTRESSDLHHLLKNIVAIRDTLWSIEDIMLDWDDDRDDDR